MNILVTGACGFIGSHLVEKLVKSDEKWYHMITKFIKDHNIIYKDYEGGIIEMSKNVVQCIVCNDTAGTKLLNHRRKSDLYKKDMEMFVHDRV